MHLISKQWIDPFPQQHQTQNIWSGSGLV